MKSIVWGSILGLLFVQPGWTQGFEIGDWVWNAEDPEVYWAATTNDAGQMLAQFCDPEDGVCFYAVGFDTNCEEDASYPALVNSDIAAQSIELRCGSEVDDGGHLMHPVDFDQIDKLVRQANRIGFALPMEGDEFKAVRFSLRGSNEALDAMRDFAQKGSRQSREIRKAKDTEVF